MAKHEQKQLKLLIANEQVKECEIMLELCIEQLNDIVLYETNTNSSKVYEKERIELKKEIADCKRRVKKLRREAKKLQ